jgi:hypothetical protein
MTAVLHAWGQTLPRAVHLHCLIPCGAVAVDGSRHAVRTTILFPVRVLSRHVRVGSVSRLRAVAPLPRPGTRGQVRLAGD